jgi:hypothetical protein
MKHKNTIGNRCAAILRKLGKQPHGVSYQETARIINGLTK